MRWIRPLLATAAAIVLIPTSATAATTYRDSINGVEHAATATQGSFVAAAVGDLPGVARATVVHTGLNPSAAITGGDFSLTTRLHNAQTEVTGNFTRGTVTLRSPSGGCGNQSYAVSATLANVRFGSGSAGYGTLTGTLTHYRAMVLQRCVPVAARIDGSLTLTQP
jgi:hypothetical protein